MAREMACSFCGKNQDIVKKLIAGPGVYICNECVDLCLEILDEEEISRHSGIFNFTSTEIADLKVAKEEQAEKVKVLIHKAIEPLELVVEYYEKSNINPYFEPGIRSLIFLKLQHDGKYSKDLIPHLECLAKHYTNQRQYESSAEVLEWSHDIRNQIGIDYAENRVEHITEIVKAHMRAGNISKADDWLDKLKQDA